MLGSSSAAGSGISSPKHRPPGRSVGPTDGRPVGRSAGRRGRAHRSCSRVRGERPGDALRVLDGDTAQDVGGGGEGGGGSLGGGGEGGGSGGGGGGPDVWAEGLRG